MFIQKLRDVTSYIKDYVAKNLNNLLSDFTQPIQKIIDKLVSRVTDLYIQKPSTDPEKASKQQKLFNFGLIPNATP